MKYTNGKLITKSCIEEEHWYPVYLKFLEIKGRYIGEPDVNQLHEFIVSNITCVISKSKLMSWIIRTQNPIQESKTIIVDTAELSKSSVRELLEYYRIINLN